MAPKKQEEPDEIEEIFDDLEEQIDDYTQTMHAALIVVAFVGAAIGAGISYFVTKRRLTTKYEIILEEEIAAAKAFYNSETKKVMASVVTPQVTEEEKAENEELVSAYQGEPERNVFREAQIDTGWDQEAEDELRATLELNQPFVISQDEFLENEHDFRNLKFTYFEEDGVLVDHQEEVIPAIDETVGEENLNRFGAGSNDRNLLHVRNTRLSLDIEIARSEGSYAKEVLGFIEHSDEPKIRKMRPER